MQEHLEALSDQRFETLAQEHAPLHAKALEDELAQLLQVHKANNTAFYDRNKYPIQLSAQSKVLETSIRFAPSRNTPPVSLPQGPRRFLDQ